jgi:hypothetical protein
VEFNEKTKPTLLYLAKLTDPDIARIALNAAAAAHNSLVDDQVVIGANGNPRALHIRVGRGVDAKFDEWDQRTLKNGEEFAANTGDDGKAGTVAECNMDSATAYFKLGDAVGEGPRRWRGGKYAEVAKMGPDDQCVELDPAVSAASGAQGAIDEVAAATGSQAVAALTLLRDEAQELLTQAGIDWNADTTPDTLASRGERDYPAIWDGH